MILLFCATLFIIIAPLYGDYDSQPVFFTDFLNLLKHSCLLSPFAFVRSLFLFHNAKVLNNFKPNKLQLLNNVKCLFG